ncbi:unnamed protein product [Phytophthora lilii]|uniref:Unnamed protein product n=1 Tax=Phytophthora lilii TaxID=2077276 RepID=A0A9W6TV20_9STRA|nr:unnamed protein product [Phytophthora lilii]
MLPLRISVGAFHLHNAEQTGTLRPFPNFRAGDQAKELRLVAITTAVTGPISSIVMAFIRSVALLAALAFASSTAQDDPIVGGYTEKTVTSEDLAILAQAAGNATLYDEDVATLICLLDVDGLETQVVSGTNYKFHVAGCSVGSKDQLGDCHDQNCESSSYDIVIYSQPWTNTLEVTSITETHLACRCYIALQKKYEEEVKQRINEVEKGGETLRTQLTLLQAQRRDDNASQRQNNCEIEGRLTEAEQQEKDLDTELNEVKRHVDFIQDAIARIERNLNVHNAQLRRISDDFCSGLAKRDRKKRDMLQNRLEDFIETRLRKAQDEAERARSKLKDDIMGVVFTGVGVVGFGICVATASMH